ncbi:LLM class flavin-dependent oxidoreductase [Micromonospora sp. WMMD558]|uniref:LLM class flavin-dependent oxidoreductase n=1 Tax=Micromonospora sp. WMMD558 TaxID=3403462 RepID=UPI003BF4E94D
MTAPMYVDYHDILRVRQEADAIAEIEHAWLFDHLIPISGDPGGPAYEGSTLLCALATQTERLRLGVMVTSNRFRPPAMLPKIATVVDIVPGGRLDFGIGVGSRPGHPLARREYAAHGLPFADAVGNLAEALTVIRRLWTDNEPFDFFDTLAAVLRPGLPVEIVDHDPVGAVRKHRRVRGPSADPYDVPRKLAFSSPSAARIASRSRAVFAVVTCRSRPCVSLAAHRSKQETMEQRPGGASDHSGRELVQRWQPLQARPGARRVWVRLTQHPNVVGQHVR